VTYAIGEKTRTAKRDWKRKCDLCQGAILKGDFVTTYIVRDGGDFGGCVEHAVCRSIAGEYHAHTGYPHDDEWPMLVDLEDDHGEALATAQERLRIARCGA